MTTDLTNPVHDAFRALPVETQKAIVLTHLEQEYQNAKNALVQLTQQLNNFIVSTLQYNNPNGRRVYTNSGMPASNTDAIEKAIGVYNGRTVDMIARLKKAKDALEAVTGKEVDAGFTDDVPF